MTEPNGDRRAMVGRHGQGVHCRVFDPHVGIFIAHK